MAQQVLDEMVIRLLGDARDYKASLEKSASQTRQTMDHIQRDVQRSNPFAFLSKSALALAGTLGITFGAKGAFDAFAEAESISLKLNAALEANGRNVAAVRKDYEEFAKALMRVTTAEDDATLKMLQTAESLGLTDVAAKRAVKNAVALAAAKGGEAEGYLRVTAALEQGATEMLGRFLPALRSIEDPTERARAAQEMLAKMFGTAKAEAQSSAGQMTQLKNEFGNLAEEVGGLIAGPLRSVVSAVRRAVTAGQEWVDSIGGLPDLWEDITEAASSAWEWIAPVRESLGSLWQTIKEGASDAWSWVKTTAEEAWEATNASALINWESIRETIADAILFAEFTLRNFGDVAEYVWTETKLGFVTFANEVDYFFREVIPATLEWFSEEWQNIFTDIFNWTKTVFTNLGNNIAEIVKNIPALIKGEVDFSDLWTDLEAGFERASKELILPDRVKGELERELEELAASQASALSRTWEEFRDAKKKAFEAERMLPDDEVVETEDKALDLGTALTDAFKPPRKEAEKLKESYQAAVFGSAEALERIQRFRDALSKDKKQGEKAAEGKPAAGFADAEAKERLQKQVDELKEIKRIAQQQLAKPVIVVEGANL